MSLKLKRVFTFLKSHKKTKIKWRTCSRDSNGPRSLKYVQFGPLQDKSADLYLLIKGLTDPLPLSFDSPSWDHLPSSLQPRLGWYVWFSGSQRPSKRSSEDGPIKVWEWPSASEHKVLSNLLGEESEGSWHRSRLRRSSTNTAHGDIVKSSIFCSLRLGQKKHPGPLIAPRDHRCVLWGTAQAGESLVAVCNY